MNLFKSLKNRYITNRRNILNSLFSSKRQKKLLKKEFSIISNNCWGGLIYPYYGLPYMSPTAGLYFYDEDYLKFVGDLKRYINMDLKFISVYKSKHREVLFQKGQEKCPIGLLEDVEIIFLHYKTEDEARTKWNRRKKRICWDNIILKYSQSKLTTVEMIRYFESLPYKKVVFVTEDFQVNSQIIFPEFKKIGWIPNDTDYLTKHFEPTDLINK